jgi:hypothetical protein
MLFAILATGPQQVLASSADQASFQLAQASNRAAPGPAGAGQPNLLGQYGDWGAYSGGKAGARVCFALAKPTSSQTVPPNRPRDPTYFFLTTRPADNVRNEVSVIIGYSFKPNSETTAEVGSAKFPMYTESDGAWIKDANEEARLVDTMRKGTDLVIKGTSARGTQTTDRYSLKGLAQALDRVSQECK